MKNYTLFSAVKTAFVLSFVLFTISSCSNSTANEEEEEIHAEGFVLKMNGQNVIEQLPGQEISGQFNLTVGQETDLITIYFIDDEGDQFQPEEDEVSLSSQFSTSGVAEFEQHAEDGTWSFHLHGESGGSTQLTLKLLHGDHSDFTTKPIPINVEDQSN
ncbi:MAG: hypothetical protein FH748_00310 [Balneolaceae bacterium]|nr:hypothetical protein [Balneolaceae bacterium]